MLPSSVLPAVTFLLVFIIWKLLMVMSQSLQHRSTQNSIIEILWPVRRFDQFNAISSVRFAHLGKKEADEYTQNGSLL